jgi:hypothetical protein
MTARAAVNRVADRAAVLADRKAAARARPAALADLAREALRQPFLAVCEPEVRRLLARECLAAASALALTELGATEAGAALQLEARKCFEGPERGMRPRFGLEPRNTDIRTPDPFSPRGRRWPVGDRSDEGPR